MRGAHEARTDAWGFVLGTFVAESPGLGYSLSMSCCLCFGILWWKVNKMKVLTFSATLSSVLDGRYLGQRPPSGFSSSSRGFEVGEQLQVVWSEESVLASFFHW